MVAALAWASRSSGSWEARKAMGGSIASVCRSLSRTLLATSRGVTRKLEYACRNLALSAAQLAFVLRSW